MPEPLPVVLVPGLNCSARLYGEQVPALWRFGPVQIADHTRDDSMDAIPARMPTQAPPSFALEGLSMGGFAPRWCIGAHPKLPPVRTRRDPKRQAERRRKLGTFALN